MNNQSLPSPWSYGPYIILMPLRTSRLAMCIHLESFTLNLMLRSVFEKNALQLNFRLGKTCMYLRLRYIFNNGSMLVIAVPYNLWSLI